MKKRGFTLIELMGVLVLLAAIILIIVPVVDKQLKEGKQDLYDSAIDSISLALQDWFSDQKISLADGEKMTITLSQLKQSDKIDKNVTNPKTEELFPNDMQLVISKQDGKTSYQVMDETGNNKQTYDEDMPSLLLNGEALIYVEVDHTGSSVYVDAGATSKDKNGNDLSFTTQINPALDTTKTGIYNITYSVTSHSKTNQIMRTIIVRDTKAPEIYFSGDLTVSLKDLNSFQFEEADVTVSDNSGESCALTVEKNFSGKVGTHTITYKATDSSGNVATKFRKVNITE